jgi:hypothetical protein
VSILEDCEDIIELIAKQERILKKMTNPDEKVIMSNYINKLKAFQCNFNKQVGGDKHRENH